MGSIKVTTETKNESMILTELLQNPGEMEELEEYITEVANSNYEQYIYINYKGINLILERVTMIPS